MTVTSSGELMKSSEFRFAERPPVLFEVQTDCGYLNDALRLPLLLVVDKKLHEIVLINAANGDKKIRRVSCAI